jgi:hypothetical protein
VRSFGIPPIPYRIAETSATAAQVFYLKNSAKNRFARLKVNSQAETTNFENNLPYGDE